MNETIQGQINMISNKKVLGFNKELGDPPNFC